MSGTNTNLPNLYEIFKAMHEDFHYCLQDQTSAYPTKELADSDGIEALELGERLFDAITSTAELPFIVEKNLDRCIIRKESRLISNGFYKYWQRSRIPNLAGYQFSEGIQVLLRVSEELRLSQVNFSGDPLSLLNRDGLLEGELINSFVLRVRDVIRTKQMIRQIEERKSQVKSDMRVSKLYAERIVANTPHVLIQRFDLHYHPQASQTISLHESNQHLDRFIEALKTQPELGFPVGWWWKREHLTEIGFVYSMVVFYDTSNHILDPLTVTTLLEIGWQNVTNNQGACTAHNYSSNSHKRLGNGFVSPTNPYPVQDLLFSIRLLILRDNYLRLSPNTKHSHIGMGPLPVLVKNHLVPPMHVTQQQLQPYYEL